MNTSLKKEDIVFVSVVVLVHVLFYILARHFTRIYMGDSFEYIYEAINIKSHFFFYSGNPALPVVPEFLTQRQPGYPLFLLSVYSFAVNNWVLLVLQNMLSIFNIFYCKHIFAKLGLRNRSYILLLVLLIAYPAQFINANTIAPDILLQTCTVLYFGNFILLLQHRSSKNALYMSLWLIAGFMVKPVLYPFCIIHIVLLMVCVKTHKAPLRSTIVIALLPLLTIWAYNYSNYTRTGKFHFSSNQSFNAIYYFFSYFNHRNGSDSANHFLTVERTTINSIPDFKTRYDYANAQGLALLKGNFAPYMVYHLENSARMFIEPGKAEMDLFTGKLTYGILYSKQNNGFYATLKAKGWTGLGHYLSENRSIPIVFLIFIFNCVRLIGILMFLRIKAIPGIVRLFIAGLLCYFAVAAGPIANTRYFLPVSLIAICCGAIGLSTRIKPGRQIIE